MTPPDETAQATADAVPGSEASAVETPKTTEAAPKPSLLQPEATKGKGANGTAAEAAPGPAWTPTIPEGVVVPPEQIEVVKGLGLPPEASQKVLDAAVQWQGKQNEAAILAWEKQGQEWFQELQSDKEFGGKNFAPNAAAAQKAVLQFGGPKFATELQERGLDNFPPLARFLSAVGKALGEDSLAGTSQEPARTPANDEEAFKRAMFPSMFPKES